MMRQGSSHKLTRNATIRTGNNVSLITIDFETYYTKDGLGFAKQTTEEYIRDPRFEVIGVAVQVDAGDPV